MVLGGSGGGGNKRGRKRRKKKRMKRMDVPEDCKADVDEEVGAAAGYHEYSKWRH